MITKQENNPTISPTLNFVKTENKPIFRQKRKLGSKTRILLNYWKNFKINKKGLFVKDTNNIAQIVLPKSFIELVFEELHNKMGHLGYERVIELCKHCFYRPNFEKDIKQYVTKECKYLKDKKLNLAQKAPLEITTSTQPFEIITTDYLYFEQYQGKYEYFLAVVTGNNLESSGSIQKNKKGAFKTVKGHFVW